VDFQILRGTSNAYL
jgi:hypothetical protein